MSGSNVGAKAICAVVDTSGKVLPCIATDNGNDTCTLKIDEISINAGSNLIGRMGLS